MADLIEKSVNMTAALLVFALVALPVGYGIYYENLVLPDSAPGSIQTILEYLPVILTAAIAFGAFKKFR